jgi:hypothetical protein
MRRIRFNDKRRHAHFHDVRQNERRARFHDKRRRTLRNVCLLYLHNQRRAIRTCVSLLLLLVVPLIECRVPGDKTSPAHVIEDIICYS